MMKAIKVGMLVAVGAMALSVANAREMTDAVAVVDQVAAFGGNLSSGSQAVVIGDAIEGGFSKEVAVGVAGADSVTGVGRSVTGVGRSVTGVGR
jgi:hypothetical protein